jgi:hypothetical protein
MNRLVSLAALSSVLVIAGCRQQKPPTVVPEAPRIESFTTSAASLDAPGTVTLTWSTANTKRVELREGQNALSVPEDQVSGSLQVQVDTSSIFVLVARGDGGSEARAVSVTVAGAGSALTLVALPAAVPGGDTTTLAWTAPGAQSVTLMAGTTPVDTRGQITSGAVVVRPSRDTVYTLSDGTRTASATVAVDVALLSLSSTPTAAQVGQNLTLNWTSAGADRLVVSSPGRGQLTEITDVAALTSGSYTDVVPVLPANGLLTYEVTAFKGTQQMSRTLTVFVGTELSIVRFEVPPVGKAAEQFFVRWTTIAATRVQVLVEGQLLYETPSAQLASQGIFGFAAPAADFDVQLIAMDDRGNRTTQTTQVDVVGVPTMVTLVASPTTVAAGDPVTLTFTSPDARQVRITDASGSAVFSLKGLGAESGTATVYPVTSTTFTIAADNLFGDPAVTATAAVTVTGAAPTVRQYPPTAVDGQIVELRPNVPGTALYGFPHDAVLTSAAANFYDISATGQRVLEMGSSITTVTLPFSTLLWGEPRTGPLTISRCGYVSWGAPATNDTTEEDLPTDDVPAIIAPFWNDLQLVANSAVLVELVGEAPEQRLIVQWDKVRIGSDADTQATFQLQVHQAGVVSFHYLSMDYDGVPTFKTGLQNQSGALSYQLFDGTRPESNMAVYFFSPLSVAPKSRARGTNLWGGFIKTGTSYSAVSRPALTVKLPFDIGVSELMFRPASPLSSGQYVEAYNHTPNAYDLTGWWLRSNDGTAFALPDGTTLPANGHLIVGASLDPAENDDAGVTVSWGGSGFSLAVDAGTLDIGTADAGLLLSFTGPADAGSGASVEFEPGPFVVTSSSPAVTTSCWASTPFGSQLGSPGSLPGCGYRYLRQSITPKFHDISATGTVVFAPTAIEINKFASVSLAPTGPAPVMYGSLVRTVTINMNGWLSPRTITATGSSNKSVPSSTEPFGTIAPFWDALEALANVSKVHWQRFEPGDDPATPERHWIVQWTRFNIAATPPATPDELTFQAKLFENGNIEFHYATMQSGTDDLNADGHSATVWVEEPTGTRALMFSYNTARPRQNTAIRFVAR